MGYGHESRELRSPGISEFFRKENKFGLIEAFRWESHPQPMHQSDLVGGRGKWNKATFEGMLGYVVKVHTMPRVHSAIFGVLRPDLHVANEFITGPPAHNLAEPRWLCIWGERGFYVMRRSDLHVVETPHGKLSASIHHGWNRLIFDTSYVCSRFRYLYLCGALCGCKCVGR